LHSRNFDESKIEGSRDRVEGQLGLIKDVSKWIPDFDAIFNIQSVSRQLRSVLLFEKCADLPSSLSISSDTPVSFVSASHKAELAELVADRECKLSTSS
jgi:hypothetical protein